MTPAEGVAVVAFIEGIWYLTMDETVFSRTSASRDSVAPFGPDRLLDNALSLPVGGTARNPWSANVPHRAGDPILALCQSYGPEGEHIFLTSFQSVPGSNGTGGPGAVAASAFRRSIRSTGLGWVAKYLSSMAGCLSALASSS